MPEEEKSWVRLTEDLHQNTIAAFSSTNSFMNEYLISAHLQLDGYIGLQQILSKSIFQNTGQNFTYII